jgi:hypothetical protein
MRRIIGESSAGSRPTSGRARRYREDISVADPTPPSATIQQSSRRALLTGALGGIGALAATVIGGASRVHAASGDSLILGSTTNSAGTANTSLTTNSSGTALLVTQNGSGTALRGSAVGAGSIAGFFTAQNGTGISGVTGNPNSYGVFAQNNGIAGTAGAVRASGGSNHGLVATTAAAAANAVRGITTSTGAAAIAIYGESPGSEGAGVKGLATGAVGGGSIPTGVQGFATRGDGVWGYAQYTGAEAYHGVVGESETQPGAGVYGAAYNTAGTNFGVYALAYGATGRAVYAEANSSGVNYGLYATTTSGSGYGVWSQGRAHVQGDLSVSGSLSKGGGSFKIDHPLDPAGRYLSHSFVESPDMKNVYDGVARLDAAGEVTVELPGYFEALNRDFRYQLTPHAAFSPLYVKATVRDGSFTIAGGDPGQEVSWQVTGIRRDRWADANRIVVEEAKPAAERGTYLHPELFGQPASEGADWRHRTSALQPRRSR